MDVSITTMILFLSRYLGVMHPDENPRMFFITSFLERAFYFYELLRAKQNLEKPEEMLITNIHLLPETSQKFRPFSKIHSVFKHYFELF